MSRVKTGTVRSARHKKILSQAKGYYGARHRLFRTANQAVEKAGQYAYRDRKARKRAFRRLWIQRINAAVRMHDMTYASFMNGLAKAEVEVDRKMLADLAAQEPAAFAVFVDKAKAALAA